MRDPVGTALLNDVPTVILPVIIRETLTLYDKLYLS